MTHANGFTTAELLDRKPPADPAAELMLLRAIVLDEALMDSADLRADHFHEQTHRLIFAAWAALRENNLPRDTAHLAQQLKADGHLDKIGGRPKLAEMLAGEALPARTADYLAAVRDCYARRQTLTAALGIIQTVHSDVPTADVLSEARDRLAGISDDGAGEFEFTTLTMAQLASGRDDLVFDVAGVLARNQPTILGGPPKSLKTSIATDLGLSLATATPFLGTYEVLERRRVLFMSGESGEAASRVCFNSVAASKGFNLADVKGLIWCPDVPQFGTPAHEIALRKLLKQYRPDVVILDPAYRVVGTVEHSNIFEMGAVLAEVNGMCREVGATLILLHHTKRNPARPNITTLDDLAYAGFREFFRQWILLARQGEYVPGSGLHELRIDVGGSARHSLAAAVTVDEGPFAEPRWYVTIQGVAESHKAHEQAKERSKAGAQAEKRNRDREKLVKAAARFPDGETITVLRDFASLNTPAARTALADALEADHLELCKITKNGRIENAYKLRSGTTGNGRADS